MSEPFLFQGLTAGEAQSTAEAHRAKGATAEIVPGQGVLSRSKLCIPSRQPVRARMWVRHRLIIGGPILPYLYCTCVRSFVASPFTPQEASSGPAAGSAATPRQ